MLNNTEDVRIVDKWQDCDIVMITGATMTNRDEIREAKAAGKKIVFRIDNMPKDSNNRGTAFSRMRDFILMSDFLIFQSWWAQDYVGWWAENKVGSPLLKMGQYKIIYNGVDEEFFYYKDDPLTRRGNKYLYVQYNRDENKRFAEAAMYFHKEVYRNNPNAELNIVGKFSPEMIEYGFNFFSGEKIVYDPPIENPQDMGDIMRMCKYFLFPAYADASPNTLNEALACGLRPLLINKEGGSKEIYGRYLEGINPYSIQTMNKEYYEVFKKVLNQ